MMLLKSFDHGVLECWSAGVLKENIMPLANTPTLQHTKNGKIYFSNNSRKLDMCENGTRIGRLGHSEKP